MKKIMCLMLFVSMVISTYGQEKTKNVKLKTKAVTVFLSGAQVVQTAETPLTIGSNNIIFNDLTSDINVQSIQVKGEGNFSILSVSHQLNYLKSPEKTVEIQNLYDSINILQKDLEFQQAMLSVYTDEETMVLANKDLSGENTGVKATDIKDAADFYRIRLTDIRNNKLSINGKIKKIQNRLNILNNQYKILSGEENKPSSEIIVVISAETACNAKFTVQYLVHSAGWSPSYDLRATDVNSPIDLIYKANVWQTTAKDWENVKLTLCTGNPTQSGTRPNLSPWYLSYLQVYNTYYESDKKTERAQAPASTPNISGSSGKGDDFNAKTGADYSVINENQTNIEFEISIPYTILSDGKKKIIEIQRNTLPSTYKYYCAPKLDPDAFLMARVSGWEQYNLLPGEMNLFFEGTYLGKSYMNPKYTKDTLDISLGRDKSIVVTREKVKDYSSTKLIGTNTKETYAWDITVRNKKKTAVSIDIEDQLPISTDKDIIVEAIETSGAIYDEITGKLTWKINLKPSETKTFRIAFSVKYPRDKQINF